MTAEKETYLDPFFTAEEKDELEAGISGVIERIERKSRDKEEIRLCLKDCTGILSGEETMNGGGIYELGRVTVIFKELPGSVPQAAEGRRVQVRCRLAAMEEPRNPGQFDSRGYYRALGISYFAYGENLEEISGSCDILRVSMRKLREWMAENLERAAGGQDAGLFRAMVLGEKWAAEEETRNLYQNAGIGHLFAISGLHISLAGMGIYRILRKGMKRSFSVAALGCAGASYCYYLMTGEGTSAGRAFLMLSVYGAGQVFGRQYDLSSGAAFAALLLLVRSPLLLFQSGFQLSFGSVLALGSLHPCLQSIFQKESRTSRAKEKEKGSKKWRRKLLMALLPGLAIQLATIPVQAASFYQIPVFGLLLNLLLLPLFPVIAFSGIFGAFLGGLFPQITRTILFPARFLLRIYASACSWSLRLPGSIWRTGRPENWQLLLYGVLLAALLCFGKRGAETRRTAWRRTVRRRTVRIGIWIVPFCLMPLPWRGLELVFLDVGQGDGCFIQIPHGPTFLIDGGSSSEKEIGKYCLIPFLDSYAVDKVDYVMVSHGDEDHINGIRELIEEKRIANLILPEGQEKEQEALGGMKNRAEQLGIPVQYLKQGEILHAGEASLACLWPEGGGGDADSGLDSNEASMVLWFSYRKLDVLFTGDLEGAGEEGVKRYLEKWGGGKEKKIDVLKAAHHGSQNACSEELLREINPLYTVISCGRGNRYGHPAKETLQRLEAVRSRVFRTDKDGAVTVRSDGVSVKIQKTK
ncbi:DNA internalization-related competence protein ComEC/Rec2 [Qiania dongpingensis]|uniref:DNA internalization-related competence protein ComEC/Rec2 n=2 Tax=Qiania dongpingensis TaxID=2763669 RepID=A0A7G9G6H2_9FIRM|nr:DNA internalization-related competence protein ComEC/Rec2 [Qiania dongpingensis]